MTKWIAIATTALFVTGLHAQAPQQPPQPRFEVASIRENKTNDGIVSIQTQKGRYVARGFTLAALIRNAYRVQEFQIIGGPEWLNIDRFDVEAVFSEDNRARVDVMLRALLAERFKLTVHNEKRERPIFALTLARADKRLGPELQKSTTDCGTAKGPDACGSTVAPGFIRLRGRTMAQFAESLSTLTVTGSSLNRLIVDRTGLDGAFNVTLKFTPDNIPPAGIPGLPPVDPNGPSIFTAMQDQLALRSDRLRLAADAELTSVDPIELRRNRRGPVGDHAHAAGPGCVAVEAEPEGAGARRHCVHHQRRPPGEAVVDENVRTARLRRDNQRAAMR